MYHKSVLLKESVDGLDIQPDGIYVDVTFGGGGHSREILKRLDSGRLVAFDQDADAVDNEIEDDRFLLVRQNFRYLRNFLKLHRALPFNGLLADLGVSSHQFDAGGRGFSIRFDGPLDMRMNQKVGVSAKEVLNEYEEDQLLKIFRVYGEIKQAGRLVNLIVKNRLNDPIETTSQLIGLLETIAPFKKQNQFYAQVFQALRIEVNDELKALEEMLVQASEGLAPGGRLVVISYHSLEDRLVKNFFKTGNFQGDLEKDFFGNIQRPLDPLSGKVIIPTEQEIQENPRARSAKMRIAVKRHE
tara:strand:- start:110 stop:1009 length:900 start_codon:yes stop_codon:yes gene_type:complete